MQRVAVPFGVIGMIYEARPNVTYDVFLSVSRVEMLAY